MKVNGIELEEILEKHKKWLYNEDGGERANLRGADLRDADLWGANLRGADLWGANLCNAKLCGADLCGANLCGANLYGANLYGADLCNANLRNADLRNANLCGATGNKDNIKSIQLEKYDITYTSEVIQIGCKNYTIEEWFNFTNDEISKMDYSALDWWNKWKDTIKSIIEMSPANPTK